MQPCVLCAGTEDGLRIARITDGDRIEHPEAGVKGQAVRAIALRPDDPSTVCIGYGLASGGDCPWLT